MPRRVLLVTGVVCLLILSWGRVAVAQSATVTLAWDAPIDSSVTGYVVSYGTQSGTYPNVVDVANVTSSSVSGLSATTTYYFIVQSYNASRVFSTPTPELPYTTPGSTATPPTITTQPSSQTLVSGNTAALSVAATGTAPLSYQWYVGTSGTTAAPVAGGTTASYATPALTSTTSYWVRVTNAAGSANSTTATITVRTPPTITAQPSSQTLVTGNTAALSVTATGTAPLSYQWYVGTSGTTAAPVAGATAASYATPALTSTTSYWVRVTNAAGSANSTTATITVTTLPIITAQPSSQKVAPGKTAALSVTATGTAPLSYQWYVGTSGTTAAPVAGATAASYTTPAIVSTTSYWVRVSNTAGSANSVTATLTVMRPPKITAEPQSQTLAFGTSAVLSVTASGDAPLTYQWYVGTSGTTTVRTSGATDSSYTTPTLTSTTSYWVRVTNEVGSVDSATATMTVATAPVFTDDPLVPGSTVIKAVYITELRTHIDAVRTRYGMPAYSYTNPSIVAGMSGLASTDITEMHTALAAVYTAAGQASPSFNTKPGPGGLIRASDIAEIRSAVLVLESGTGLVALNIEP